jgi:ABC-2 type transport system ATP-binding protein
MLQLRGLEKRYGARAAVAGLDLEVRRGETLGLLGPNGAGKTTTMMLIVGAIEPDAGRVVLRGGRDASRASRQRRIGIAPQELALYPELSAEENLRFFGSLYDLGPAELDARVAAMLDLAGLTERRRDRVRHFSGGMQRRLNIACAVVHGPELLLLDEPTVGVDPQSRNHIFDTLEALKAEGLTLLYSTHYMEEAERLCDRVAIVDSGRVLAVGSIEELVKAHGGRATLHAELRAEPGSALPGRAEPDGAAGLTRLSLATDDPTALVAELIDAGHELVSLHVERPNLEGVFLALTGKTLRD